MSWSSVNELGDVLYNKQYEPRSDCSKAPYDILFDSTERKVAIGLLVGW